MLYALYVRAVFTGRFHAYIQAVIVKQPLFEAEDVIVKGRKAFFLVGGFNTPGGLDDCDNQKSLVDINTTTVLISNFDKNISFRKKTLTCGYHGEAIDCSATHLTGVKTILSVRTRITTYLCLKSGTYTDLNTVLDRKQSFRSNLSLTSPCFVV